MSKSKALLSKNLSSEEIRSELNALIDEYSYFGTRDAPIHRIRDVFLEVIREKLRHIETIDAASLRGEDHSEYLREGTIFYETSGMSQLLENRQLGIKEAMLVFNGLLNCVETEPGWPDIDSVNENGEFIDVNGEKVFPPRVLDEARMRVLDIAYIWYRKKTIAEIKHLTLVEKIAEVERRIVTEREAISPTAHCYEIALTELDTELLATLEVEKSRIRNYSDTGPVAALKMDDEYDPAKRGLTRQLAMLLLDNLFPNLSNATPSAKGAFLRLLTGFNAKGLANKWGDYNFDSADYQRDLEEVESWKRKLRIKD